jgi:hypothetical protein
MAPKTPDALGSWTGLAKQTSEQITERTQEAMANYLSWLQNAMQASPWGNTDLNKKLMSYATEGVSAASEFTHQLSRAQSVEDAIRIQTEFVKTQMEMDAFGQRAKEVGEMYTKVATAATKTPFGMST